MKPVGIIILAAGQGTRMRSELPKVLHHLAGKPLLFHVLRTARRLSPERIAVVVGHGAEAVKKIEDSPSIHWIVQAQQLGTGHAALCAQTGFGGFTGDILILSGDVPLLSPETIRGMIERHRDQAAAVTLLTVRLDQPAGYGRILRTAAGQIGGIVEEKDATEEQRRIREINAGVYVAAAPFLFDALKRIDNRNRQGEYYLPDIVRVALREQKTVAAVTAEDAREVMGINTREELAQMEKILQEKINRQHMLAGVTLKDPQTTYIDEGVTIGKDTIIGPNTHLRGNTAIGEKCRIDGSAFLTDARIGNGVHLRFSVVLTGCRVEDGAIVGPFAHLRPGTALGQQVHIGNFVETKEARIGAGTKANHLTYLGDVTIGRDTNIGAGTITCNYDGFRKYKTQIGDRVQVGSDSTLVAPVSLGDDVYVATATTVRRDVPSGALVFNERQERIRAGWTEQKRAKMKGSDR